MIISGVLRWSFQVPYLFEYNAQNFVLIFNQKLRVVKLGQNRFSLKFKLVPSKLFSWQLITLEPFHANFGSLAPISVACDEQRSPFDIKMS